MRRLLPALIGLAGLGCGGTNIVPVSGVVKLNDQPLPNATVVFEPDSQEKEPGPGSSAITDSEGRYSLNLATGAKAGAVIGKHKVSITAYDGDPNAVPSSGSDMKVSAKPLVPAEYNVKSTLTFDVPASGTDQANFNLKGPAIGKK
jgi:hypothetical protein